MARPTAVKARLEWVVAALFVLGGFVAVLGSGPGPAWARAGESDAGGANSAANSADTLGAASLIEPEALAAALKYPAPQRPAVLQVGFKVLYRTGHIAGSEYVGPGSKPEGLAALKGRLKTMRRNRPVVLYCGCCPWEDCPNVRPAFREARALGFQNVKVLFVRKNLQDDWIGKGLPMREGE